MHDILAKPIFVLKLTNIQQEYGLTEQLSDSAAQLSRAGLSVQQKEEECRQTLDT